MVRHELHLPEPEDGAEVAEDKAREFLADILYQFVSPAEWFKDKVANLIKGLAAAIIAGIVWRYTLLSSPMRPIETLAGIGKELARPTVSPEFFIYGVALFFQNTIIFLAFYIYKVGPVFRNPGARGVFLKGAPLPPHFWMYYLTEILGTLAIPVGLMGFLLGGLGVLTWFIGWAILLLTLLSLPHTIAMVIALFKLIRKRSA